MPEGSDIALSTQSLADLLARERFLSAEESKANMAATAAPLIYKSLQQEAKFTDAVLPNAALNMLAPAIGAFAGIQNPRIAPQVSPGMSPFEAAYIADVNTPMATNFRNAFNQNMGGAMGEGLGAIANNLGFNKVLGMSPQQLSANMANFGQSQAGQFLAEMAMRQPAVQAIMGGDPQKMQEGVFANRHKYGLIPGNPISPMDLAGQMNVTAHAMDIDQELMNKIYPKGIVPDYKFTRGFRPEEMGETMAAMAERGAGTMSDSGADVSQGMRGMDIDPRRKVQALGEMNRVMESLKDLMGGGSIQQLLSTLDGLTQLQWPTMNRPKLEQTFREMSATANLLNVSGQTMMATTQQAQYGLQGSLGIGQQQAALGVTAGAYTGLEASAQLASSVLAISSHTGKPVDVVMAQQVAANALGMNSARGRDMQHIGYLAQEGMVSPETYANLKTVNSYGDISQTKALVDTIFTGVYGSAQQGRAISNSPGQMQQIRSDTKDPGIVQDVYEAVRNGQAKEFMDRSSRDLQGTGANYIRNLQQMTGLPMITTNERAAAQKDATVAYFKDTIGGEEGAHLARIAEEIYATGKTPSQGASRMNNFINTSPETVQYREPVKRAQAAGVSSTELGNIHGKDWAGAQDFAMDAAGLKALQSILPGDTDVKALLRERTQLATAMRKSKGTPEEAAAIASLSADFTTHYNAKFEGLSPDAKRSVNAAAEVAATAFINTRNAGRGTAQAEEMVNKGNDLGLGFGTVLSEATNANILMNKFGLGQVSAEDALKMLNGGPVAGAKYYNTISDSTKEVYTAAINAGKDSPELKEAVRSSRATVLGLQTSKRRVADARAGTGAINIYEAIGDQNVAGDLQAALRAGTSTQMLYEAVLNESGQDRRMTLSQRAFTELTRVDDNGNPVGIGKATLPNILGIEGSPDQAEAMKAIDANPDARGASRRLQHGINALYSGSGAGGVAAHEIAALEKLKNPTLNVATGALWRDSTAGTMTDEKYEKFEADVVEKMKELKMPESDIQSKVLPHLRQLRTAGTTYGVKLKELRGEREAVTADPKISEIVTKAQERTTAIESGPKRTDAWRQHVEMTDAADALDEISGGRWGDGVAHGAAFAGGITVDKKTGAKELGIGGGKKESVSAILTDFLGRKVGTGKDDVMTGLKEFSGMDFQQLKTKINERPDLAPKLSALINLKKEQQEDLEKGAGKAEKHASGGRNHITGTLTLRGRAGNDMGHGDFSGRMSTT